MSRKGLVLGKFMPLHQGHLALIDFARARCDSLVVLLCGQDDIEPIPSALRRQWLSEALRARTDCELVFTDVKLPNTSESSQEISRLWAEWIGENIPGVDVFFSSEPYGKFVAEFLGIEHEPFDPERSNVPVSGTEIRKNPLKYWEYLARPARPYFVKKVAVVGTESTGKSTLAMRLAAHYRTVFVPEAARDLVPDSNQIDMSVLNAITTSHAKAIAEAVPQANRLLFSDTELRSTAVYAKYFFDESLDLTPEILAANRFDLYLLLENDVPFVQDGSRLTEQLRNDLQVMYRKSFAPAILPVRVISGPWPARFEKAIEAVQTLFE